MKIFDTQPKPGMPVRHGTFYKALVRMARAWEQLRVHNGHVDWSNGMPTIVVDEMAALAFPWDKISFGFTVNPDGDNAAEVNINTGSVWNTPVSSKRFVISGSQQVMVSWDYYNVSGVLYKTGETGSGIGGATCVSLLLYNFTESGGSIGDGPTFIWHIGGFDNPFGESANIVVGANTYVFANGQLKYHS